MNECDHFKQLEECDEGLPTQYLFDMLILDHTLHEEGIEEELQERDSRGESQ